MFSYSVAKTFSRLCSLHISCYHLESISIYVRVEKDLMTKNRLVKTALCMVLAFAMTFAPIFSSYAMIANAMGENDTQTIESQEPSADESAQPADTASDEGTEGVTSEDAPTDADISEDQEEQAAGETEEALPVEEAATEEATATKTEYVWEDSELRVKAVLSDASAIPDDAKLIATPLTSESDDYNYDAYMEALNNDSEKSYDERNTLLYDIAFIKDGVELQPEAGEVSVTFEFLDKQLKDSIGAEKAADVNVIHLPLKDEIKDKYDTTAEAKKISADDIKVEEITGDDNGLKVSVKNEKVVFNTDSFSVFAYTVDFEYEVDGKRLRESFKF